MYTVLIVEDEVFVSVGLRNMIRWSDMNMEVIGEARNGKSGLEIYHQTKPDLIITDIKMPVMGGIDMISQIRKTDTRTRIVVLSCYEDYELVRQCFKLGISDYILKVKMMPEDIEVVIRKVQHELAARSNEASESAKDKRQQEQKEMLERCREFIVCPSVFNRKAAVSTSEDSLAKFRSVAKFVQLEEKGIAVSIMEIFFNAEMKEEEKQRNGQIALELIQKLLTENQNGIILWEQENRYLLILNFSQEELIKGREALMDELLQKMKKIIRTYVNGEVFLGVSRIADSFEKLHKLYEEALTAWREAVFLGMEMMFYGSTTDVFQYKMVIAGIEKKVEDLEVITEDCKKRIIKEIAFHKENETVNIDILIEAFCRWIHRISFDNLVQKENAVEFALEAASKMRTAGNLLDLIEGFEQYMENISCIKDGKKVSSEVLCALEYISENYCTGNMTLSYMANHIGLNKDYFSTLFKREMGCGFIDYVNRMRISRACELLEESTYRVCEVSQMVGFQDESYFSRVFKKSTGVRPNEYRRRMILTDRFTELDLKNEACK